MRQLYVGIDLHSSNSFIGISDETDKRHYCKRLPNTPDVILAELEPFKQEIVGIVVESTFNWYWLVDLLMDNAYKLHGSSGAAGTAVILDGNGLVPSAALPPATSVGFAEIFLLMGG